MTSDHTDDAAIERLRCLQVLAPDPKRADLVKQRCRARLDRIQHSPAGRGVVTWPASRVLTPIVVALCVLYFAALVGVTLRLHQVLQ